MSVKGLPGQWIAAHTVEDFLVPHIIFKFGSDSNQNHKRICQVLKVYLEKQNFKDSQNHSEKGQIYFGPENVSSIRTYFVTFQIKLEIT